MEQLNKTNPANDTAAPLSTRKRIPMSAPQQKLSVPAIPGYHCHWMIGTPERLSQADRAGYLFVDQSEVVLNDLSMGGDGLKSGSTDMGTRVSVLAGGGELGSDGQPIRLYLMKQLQEHYEEDQMLLQERTEHVINSLNVGLVGAEEDKAGDRNKRYVDKKRTTLPDMFKPKGRIPMRSS